MNFKFFIFILSAFPSSIVGAAAAKTSSHVASFWLTCSSQFVSWPQALISGSAGHVVLAKLGYCAQQQQPYSFLQTDLSID